MIDAILSFPQIIYIGLNDQYEIVSLSPAAEQYLSNSLARIKGSRISEALPAVHPAVLNVEREGQFSLYDQKFFMLNTSAELIDIHQFRTKDAINILIYPKPSRSDSNLTDAAKGALRQASGMAAMLSHEIRNPLGAIKGAAQLLSATAQPDDADLIKVIEEESGRIGRIVNDFEEMAGDTHANIQAVNIHLILNQVLRAARAGYSRDIRFDENYDPSLPEISADADRLQRALSNILKNSTEAIINRFESATNHGRISVTTRYRRGFKRGRVDLPVELTIADNGGGIDETLMADIYKPFVTTKTNGTGLGLSVVARTIEEIGGVMEINNVNHGCEIRMLLPVWGNKWTA